MTTYLSKSNFVAETVEAADAHFGVGDVIELGKAKAEMCQFHQSTKEHGRCRAYPLQAPVAVSMIALEVSTLPKREA